MKGSTGHRQGAEGGQWGELYYLTDVSIEWRQAQILAPDHRELMSLPTDFSLLKVLPQLWGGGVVFSSQTLKKLDLKKWIAAYGRCPLNLHLLAVILKRLYSLSCLSPTAKLNKVPNSI